MDGFDLPQGNTTPTTSNGRVTRAGRIPAGSLRELGLINWVLAKLAARILGVPRMHLFGTLGQHRRLFWLWLPYSGMLLHGRLPGADTELVILRVAHLRACEYELQHHRRMARRRGLDAQQQSAIFAWPETANETANGACGLTARQQALLAATDEFVQNRQVSSNTWQQLSAHLDRRQLIEFCMLASQYDGMAATMSTLELPLDHAR